MTLCIRLFHLTRIYFSSILLVVSSQQSAIGKDRDREIAPTKIFSYQRSVGDSMERIKA